MILTTPRLLLRPVQDREYPALRELFLDPLTQRYEHDSLTEEKARESFALMLLDRDDPAQVRRRWVITLPPDDTARGWVHLDLLNERACEYEIGWLVQPSYWNQGIATEAARVILRFAFLSLDAHRVIAFCHVQNAPSEQVMRKLGMTREGLLRQTRLLNGEWYDELIYSILDQDPGA